jgi:hypothetical protein
MPDLTGSLFNRMTQDIADDHRPSVIQVIAKDIALGLLINLSSKGYSCHLHVYDWVFEKTHVKQASP